MQEQVFKFSYSKRMHSSQNESSMNKSKDIYVEVYKAQKISFVAFWDFCKSLMQSMPLAATAACVPMFSLAPIIPKKGFVWENLILRQTFIPRFSPIPDLQSPCQVV